MAERQFFKQRTSSRVPRLPIFGSFARLDNEWGIMWAGKEGIESFISSNLEEVWNKICSPGTPNEYRGANLHAFFVDLLYQVGPKEDWFYGYVPNKKGEPIEKLVTVGGDSKTLKVEVRYSKEKPVSDKKGNITLLGLENYYEDGLPALIRDLSWDYDLTDLKTLLYVNLEGMRRILEYLIKWANVPLGITLGAVVLNHLKTNFIKGILPRLPKSSEDFVLPSLHGGRGEVYQTLVKNGCEIDMQGLYGVACTKPMPIKDAYLVPKLTLEKFNKKNDLGWVEVLSAYIPPKNGRGCLPVKYGETLTFPVGEITSTPEHPVIAFTPLLKYAVKKKDVILRELGQALYFATTLDILQDYAIYWGQRKEQAEKSGDKLGRRLARMALILVWGKLSQKEERIVRHFGPIPKEKLDDKTIFIPDDDLPLWEEKVKGYNPYRLVHISSAITNWAMLISQQMQDKLEEEYGQKVAYTDTDSYVLDKDRSIGVVPLELIGPKLGQVKVVYDNVAFLCLSSKNYIVFDWATKDIVDFKGKGIPNVEEFTIDDILNGKPLIGSFDSPTSVLEVLTDIFKYSKYPSKFKFTKEARVNRRVNRVYPGVERQLSNILEYDSKRVHPDLYTSLPKTEGELCQAFSLPNRK